MNENTTSKLVTVTPNEEGVRYVVVAYKARGGGKTETFIRIDCTGEQSLMCIRDLSKRLVEIFMLDEDIAGLTGAERRAAATSIKEAIVASAMHGADYSLEDAISGLIDSLVDDPEAEE